MTNKNINQQIQILINQFNVKNFDNVISKCKILLRKNPEYVILYNLLGSSFQNIGNYIDAKENFILGLKLDPNNLALMNNLAMSYKNLLQYKLAEELYEKIISINKNYINAYVNLGNLKRDLNKFQEAIDLYEKALIISNENPIVYYSLALAHQGIGNFEKSINYAKKTLKVDPKFTRADHLISQSTKYKENNEHYLSIKEKINNLDIKNFEKVDLFFSLAKAEEDIGNIKKASDYLLEGNKIRKKLVNYNVESELNLLMNIKKNFEKITNYENQNDNSDKIIFILGMPRSGTSLVEQIISSHSKVFGCGELAILSNIIKTNFIDDDKLISENFYKIMNDTLLKEKLYKEYVNFIKNFNVKEKYITDKAPLNFRWIGFIKQFLPNAKIIHCIRDAKNNCLSMFKNLFEGGLNFTYDQDDLVKYYKSYSDLMSFWKSKYNESILDVKYENLVQNSEREIRNIIKFCDLEWEENCLSFHENKSPIKTMSTAQARKPIYTSSIKSFDRFKNYLKILDEKL